MKKILLVASLVIVVLVAFTGCSKSKDGESTSSAKASGTIVVYTGRSLDLIEPIVEDFEKETGIKVELRDGESGELATQILTEGDASKADVFFSQDAGALGLLSDRDLLTKLPSDITQPVGDRFKSTKDEWVGTSGRARVVVYNPNLVSELPGDLDDLVSPEYKDKIAYAPTNASFHSFVTALRELKGEDAAKEWLTKFAANEPKAYAKNAEIVKAVNDGEIAMGLVNHYYLFELTKEVGADKIVAKNLFFKNKSVANLINAAGVGVLKTSDNKQAGQAFVKYLTSEKGQKYFVNETFEYPVISSVEQAKGLPTIGEIDAPDIDLSDLASLDETLELLNEVGLITR